MATSNGDFYELEPPSPPKYELRQLLLETNAAVTSPTTFMSFVELQKLKLGLKTRATSYILTVNFWRVKLRGLAMLS